MIWFTLGLFVVSFLLTALLAPKPKFENARREDLDPNNFPRATEDAPVPLVLGRVNLKGPNTLWYGQFESLPIIERVKTGLFSSTRVTVGYQYYLSIDLGLCLGPAGLLGIKIDGETVYSGDDTDLVTEDIQWQNEYDPQFPVYYVGALGSPRTIDLINDAGLTEEQIDAGDLKFYAIYTLVANLTPGAGGDPASGNWSLQTRVRAADGTTRLFAPEGTSADTDTSSEVGGDTMEVDYTIPSGARFIEIWGQYAASLHLFTIYTVSARNNYIYGFAISYTTLASDINEPSLFGGQKSGGGWVGDFSFYPGTFDQIVDPDVEAAVGAGDVPAYRGTAHIVFPNNNIGESPALRAMEFDLYSYTDHLGNGFYGKIAADSLDIDLMEAAYEILTNTWRGIGLDPSEVNIASFQAASTTLISEGNGGSLIVTSSQEARSILNEILRQVDGVLRQNQEGEIEVKLIRNDYVASSLPIYDEDDIIEITNFTKTSWEDVRSQIKVSFSTRDTDSNRTAIAQNMAVANMVGKLTTAEISFPFCYDPELANNLAARELAVLSIPLFKMTVKCNRRGYALRTADVIKISWVEYGLTEVIMRVQKVDAGNIDDNVVNLELVQDIFAVGTAVFGVPEDSGWVDDRPEPETVTGSVIELPYYFASNLEYPIPDGFGSVIPLPIQPKVASNGFDFIAGTISTELDYREIRAAEYPLSGLLTVALDKEDGFDTGLFSAGITINTIVGGENQIPTAATVDEIRVGTAGIIYMNGEWLAYEGVTDNTGSYTLTNVRRALLGTRPLTHAIGTRLFILSTDLLGEGILGNNLEEDGTVYYKFLDRVGAIVRGEGLEVEASYAMTGVADRPLRPRDLQIEGLRRTDGGPVVVAGSQSISWVSSNRAVGSISFEDDASETPDIAETYDLEVWVDGVEEVSLALTGVTSPQSVDFTSVSGTEYEVRVYSRRTTGDLKSSATYAWIPFKVSGYGYNYGFDYGGA